MPIQDTKYKIWQSSSSVLSVSLLHPLSNISFMSADQQTKVDSALSIPTPVNSLQEEFCTPRILEIYGVHFNQETTFSSWMLGQYWTISKILTNVCPQDFFFYLLLTDTETISSLLNFVNNTNFEFTGH